MIEWKKTGEEVVFDGYRKIIQKRFQFPDGKFADFDIVGNAPYVSIAAFTAAREAILVKQYRPGPEMALLSFAEGYIDASEQPEDTARRELLEETGFSAGAVQFLKKMRRAYSTEERYCLLATDCQRAAQPAGDEYEFIEVVLMPLPELRKLLKDEKDSSFTNADIAYLALDHLGWL